MWREEEVFERLKAVAQSVMDDLARQCDVQSGFMAQETGGSALFNSDFFGTCNPAAALGCNSSCNTIMMLSDDDIKAV